MRTKSAFFYFIFFNIFYLFSCEKEYSSENNTGISASSGTSSYSFVDANTNCTTAIINGTYMVNLPATQNNTVQLQVKVTAPGTYSISTPTIDGLSFYASGTFTKLGVQPILFYASGKPVVHGSFPYSPGNNGCSFTITINDAGVVTPPANPAPVTDGSFSCKIDGVLNTFNYNAIATTTTQVFTALNVGGFQIASNGGNVPEFQFYISKNDNSAITAGTYNENGFLSANGYNIEIDYQMVNPDKSLTIYNTSSNKIPPANPPFTIIITSISSKRIKGTFSGQLTDDSQGTTVTKVITEGVFDEPIQ